MICFDRVRTALWKYAVLPHRPSARVRKVCGVLQSYRVAWTTCAISEMLSFLLCGLSELGLAVAR